MASNIFNIIRLAQLNESEISGLTVQVFDELFSGFGTGQLTGIFYPLNSNPSNYITSGQAGIFITNGQTGVLLTYNDPRLISTILSQTTPLFYPLNSNPNSYISSGSTGGFGSFALLNGNNNFSGINTFSNSTNFSGLINITGTSQINFPDGYISNGVIYNNLLGNNIIDWGNGYLLSNSNVTSIDWVNQFLYSNLSNNIVIDWNTCMGFDRSGVISYHWHDRLLFDNSGFISADWNRRYLSGNWNIPNTGNFITSNNLSGITGNYSTTGIIDNNNINTVDWIYRLLSDTTGINSINWGSRYLYDGTQIALGPNDYGNISLDWGNRILSGNWNVSGNLLIQGNSILTGATGSFVTTSETGIFVTTGQLNSTGEYLYSLLSSGSQGGVSSINSKSGIVSIVGAGNVSVSTNNQTITVNGNTGAYANFAKLYSTNVFTSSNLFESPTVFLDNTTFNGVTNFHAPAYISGNSIITSNQTGVLTGTFARLYANNTFTSNNKFNSGIIIGGNGTSISFSNPNSGSSNYFNFIKDSNGKSILGFGKLLNIPVRNLIDEHSTIAIEFTSGLRYLYDKSGNISVDYNNRILSGNWNIQGFTGGGIGGSGTQIQITGSSYLSIANFTGIGGAQIILSGNQVLISGGAGNGTGSGIVTNNYFINSGSGAYIFSTSATSGLSSQFIQFPNSLGNNPFVLCQLSDISGNDNIVMQPSGITSSGYWAQYLNPINSNGFVVTTMAAISTSTGLATTVIINNNVNINGSTGSYVFRTNISSGVDNQFISFPQTLDNTSRVISTLGNNTFGDLFLQQTSGITSSGFWAIFSDKIDNSGYYLDTIACISTNTGLATTVIINNGTTGNFLSSFGGTVSGNVGITGYLIDNSSFDSIDLNKRLLFDGTTGISGIQNISIDYKNRILSGNWNINGTGVSINTGSLTGTFYPLTTNPSGYLYLTTNGLLIGGYTSGVYDGQNVMIGVGLNGNNANHSSIIIGYNAGTVIAGGDCSQAILIGTSAGYNASGLNTAYCLGELAGSNSINLTRSTCIGYQAGYGVDSAQYSVLIGSDMGNLKNGDFSVCIGTQLGQVGICDGSVLINAGASYCTNSVMIGGNSLSLTNANNVVLLGAGIGGEFNAVDLTNSTLVGVNVCNFTSYSTGITTLGYQTAYNYYTGDYCTFIGYAADGYPASYPTTYRMDNSTAVGSFARVSGNNATAIGYQSLALGSNIMVLGNGSINVGIGTSTPTATLHVIGSGNFTNSIIISGNYAATMLPWTNISVISGTGTWTATQNVAEDKKILILTGTTTLAINGLYNGWVGTLRTYQSGSGFNLTLPANTKVANNGLGIVNLTTGTSGAIDLLGFEFDGINLYCNIANNWT